MLVALIEALTPKPVSVETQVAGGLVEELANGVEASNASNLLVIRGAAGPILVPFDT